MFDVIIRFFQDGGAFMLPIAIVLVIGLAIALERAIYLFRVSRQNSKSLNTIQPLLNKSDFDAICRIDDGSATTNILTAGISRSMQVDCRDEIESAMEERTLEAIPAIEKRTSYLSTLANISTLLGLLGTIIGLIAAFSAVATAAPSEKAALLSQSISVAMNTTAFGLIAAIPLLVCHSVLQTKTAEVVDKLEMVGVRLINIIKQNKKMPLKPLNNS